jgi:hypothetical protein
VLVWVLVVLIFRVYLSGSNKAETLARAQNTTRKVLQVMSQPNHIPPELTTQDIFRFWSKVSFKTNNSCWHWLGNKGTRGYGQFSLYLRAKGKYRPLRAHRLAYFLMFGVWTNKCVLHKCDIPLCVNPFHLFEGTLSDNTRDMYAKGRGTTTRGRANAKLTELEVLAIRSQWRGHQDTKFLAAHFGVCKNSIRQIITRKTWYRI